MLFASASRARVIPGRTPGGVSRDDGARTRGATGGATGATTAAIDERWLDNFHRRIRMSTTETKAVPAGMWALDSVHSSVGFAVGYMAGTFTGGFSEFDAALTNGVFTGSAKVASVRVELQLVKQTWLHAGPRHQR